MGEGDRMKQDNKPITFQSISECAPIPPAQVVGHFLGLCGKKNWELSNALKLSQQTVSGILNTSAPTPAQVSHRHEIARILSSLLSEMMGRAISLAYKDLWPDPAEEAQEAA